MTDPLRQTGRTTAAITRLTGDRPVYIAGTAREAIRLSREYAQSRPNIRFLGGYAGPERLYGYAATSLGIDHSVPPDIGWRFAEWASAQGIEVIR